MSHVYKLSVESKWEKYSHKAGRGLMMKEIIRVPALEFYKEKYWFLSGCVILISFYEDLINKYGRLP